MRAPQRWSCERQGMYNGHLPFGAKKGPNGVPIPDDEAKWRDVATRAEIAPADGLRLAFALAASGQPDLVIAQALNAAGYRTDGNRGRNPFSKDTIRPILRNRFSLGEIPDGDGGWVPGRHAPMIDAAILDAVQSARSHNTSRRRRVPTEHLAPWALSGPATCGARDRNLLAH